MPGHLGWVRTCAVDVSNEWFATGAEDRQIKVNLRAITAILVSTTICVKCILHILPRFGTWPPVF
jgi:hypothetical protein